MKPQEGEIRRFALNLQMVWQLMRRLGKVARSRLRREQARCTRRAPDMPAAGRAMRPKSDETRMTAVSIDPTRKMSPTLLRATRRSAAVAVMVCRQE